MLRKVQCFELPPTGATTRFKLFFSAFISFVTIFLSCPPGLCLLVFIDASFFVRCFPEHLNQMEFLLVMVVIMVNGHGFMLSYINWFFLSETCQQQLLYLWFKSYERIPKSSTYHCVPTAWPCPGQSCSARTRQSVPQTYCLLFEI